MLAFLADILDDGMGHDRWWYGWQRPSPGQKQKSNDQKGEAKKEESEDMSEARDKKMKRKRRLEELKAVKVMRACKSWRRGI